MPATRLTATFDVTGWDAAPDSVFPHEPGEAPMTRVAVRKTFRGDLDAESVGEALLCQSADGATAPGGGYVVSERVRGTLAGRAGSFVMQHGGIAGGDEAPFTFGRIVPGSGSGALTGLGGTVEIAADADGTHRLTLTVTFGDDLAEGI